MAKTWRRAIQKYGSLGAISFEKAFNYQQHTTLKNLLQKDAWIKIAIFLLLFKYGYIIQHLYHI
jgi:hypothetical protein